MESYHCPNCSLEFKEDPREPERRQRRYALLQAAARVYARGGNGVAHCITVAEALLAEIERKETP